MLGGLALVLATWLAVRVMLGRSAPAAVQPRLRAWTNRSASLLALVIVGGMLWHVIAVAIANRLPRQDVDRSPVYERMDAITKK
jgi:hypothetical protein